MAAFNYYDSYYNEPSYCSNCGRKMQQGASSSGDYFYCSHGKEYVSSTVYPKPIDAPVKELSKNGIEKLFLIERRNEEIKRAWKKDEYAKVKAQIKI